VAFYFQLFWAPAFMSVLLIARLWARNDLSGRTPMIVAGWFLVALAAQYVATSTSLWVLGLALQTGLAVFLLVKERLDRL
jgi:hypothetical protein